MQKKINIFLVGLLILTSCSNKEIIEIKPSDSNIEYWGRIDRSSSEYHDLYWSASSVKINFEGGSISASLQDESGDNYYNILLDGSVIKLLRPDTSLKEYILAENLSSDKHTVEIYKRTEWDRGKTSLHGFTIIGKAKVLPKAEPKKLKFEFYGNSITAGYAVEDTTGNDSPDSSYTNSYLSYPNLVAQKFDAEYRLICKSGIGIMVSWFPTIMPEIYDRLIPTDEDSKWNFTGYQPDVVFVNLFQNDSWIVKLSEHEEFKRRFGNVSPSEENIINAYSNFIKNLRSHYPNSKIICLLGNMDATKQGSPWPSYIQVAVTKLNDPNIYTHFIPFKGTKGHPNIQEQEILANSIVEFMEGQVDS